MDNMGNVIHESTPQETTPLTPIPQSEPAVISYKYVFPDWNGAEDVYTLCLKYLEELRAVVNDGISKGILRN
jgi:hypothetical protein